jgi:hypothetical protein
MKKLTESHKEGKEEDVTVQIRDMSMQRITPTLQQED